MALYKYLPSQYADAFLRGEILFRNLSYFKRLDCKNRGDATEGIHRDRPEAGVSLENLSAGGTVFGDFTSLNEIDSDLVFVFCTAEILNQTLFHDFEVDCCIEINNPEEFAKRIQRKVMSLVSSKKSIGLLRGSAIYYDPGKSAEFDVKSPTKIAFAKDISYAYQKEFRFAFGKGEKSFCIDRTKVKIVISKLYDFQEEAKSSTGAEKKLMIGSIKDIARIHPESPCCNKYRA
jgi:hypothetical protein